MSTLTRKKLQKMFFKPKDRYYADIKGKIIIFCQFPGFYEGNQWNWSYLWYTIGKNVEFSTFWYVKVYSQLKNKNDEKLNYDEWSILCGWYAENIRFYDGLPEFLRVMDWIEAK